MGRESGLADPRITLPLAVTIFFSVLNGIMFNVAIPEIALGFRLMPSEVSWVMTAYIATFALGSLVYGKLADSVSVKRLITIGLLLLNLGSVIGFMASWYPMLIFARVLQASGGAAIPALAMLVATRYFPREQKGMVLGVIASTVAFGAAVGPVLGGFITGSLHWRFLFLMTLLTLLALPFLRVMLPEERPEKRGFDLPGAVLVISGVGALLVGVTQGGALIFLAAAVLLALFVLRIRSAAEPFIRPGLFSIPSYRSTVVMAVLTTGGMFGIMFAVPIMLSDLEGLGAQSIGLVMFPGAMSAAVMGRVGGRLVDAWGGRRMMVVGSLVLIMGFLALSASAGASPAFLAILLIVSYVGFSFLQSAMPHTVSSDLPREETGVGMGTYSMFFFSAGSFYTAVIGRVLDLRRTGLCLNPLARCEEGWLYSNVFLALAAMVLAGLIYFRISCRGSGSHEAC
jgi:DHA2 family metal-tetracycline-proton antiporter-like MFS transporter